MEVSTVNGCVGSRQKEVDTELLKAKKLIDETLQEHRDELKAIKSAKSIAIVDLLSISLNIRYNTHAPREYKIGFPLINGHPPAPQAEEMRTGSLATYNRMMSRNSESKTNKYNKETNSFVLQLIREIAAKDKQFESKIFEVIENGAMTKDVSGASDALKEQSPEIEDNPQPLEVIDERESKKARTVNISFGSYDSDEEDG